jgi:hypothetical protein
LEAQLKSAWPSILIPTPVENSTQPSIFTWVRLSERERGEIKSASLPDPCVAVARSAHGTPHSGTTAAVVRTTRARAPPGACASARQARPDHQRRRLAGSLQGESRMRLLDLYKTVGGLPPTGAMR